ncbi:MAG: hypothetical protein BroJett021_49990 [Chloroflexota bacterium]|nr:hypothetical protein [Caldilinea sp.]GIK76011.1 MAG: hypothetical protein BroJett021_49990 [Chloroflexota bacterium]
MSILEHNRDVWARLAAEGNPWTVPVSREEIAAARRGDWSVLLTELRPTPRQWFPDDLTGCKVLCLASGGGQQGLILYAFDRHLADTQGIHQLKYALPYSDLESLTAAEKPDIDGHR